MSSVLKFVKSNLVCIIAFILALISIIFVPIDKQYIQYINYDTILTLFMTMMIIGGFKNIRIFEKISKILVSKFTNMRAITFALVTITFLGSMVLANDMALLTFIPLTLSVMEITKEHKYAPFIITMQVVAANLGGMLTPFGNPQNLYIYSYYHIDPIEFLSIMCIPFLISICMIYILCFMVRRTKINEIVKDNEKLDVLRTVIYSVLFILAIIVIFRLIPVWIGCIVITSLVMITDYKAIAKVDFGLLLTFVFFFIFTGNIARVDFVSDFITRLITGNELLVGIVSCQLISNVPSAILLSKFTSNYVPLLVAVNIGGLGTLIASLASLIAFKQYVGVYHKPLKYILTFETINFSLLIILTLIMYFIV